MPGPLRVLMVSPQYRPMVGGYERAAERLSQALVARGHEVTVVAERRNPAWPGQERDGGLTLRRLRVVARPGLHGVTWAIALAGFLLRHGRRFDVFHVHQYGWAAAVAVVFGRLFARPVALKLTGTEENSIVVALRRKRRSSLLEGFHRRIDAFLAPSDRVVAEIERFGIPPERIHRIPNGIDVEHLQPLAAPARDALRRRLGLEGMTVALYVGRLSPEKNPLGLVDAWRRLGPPERTRLVFVGDGPEREELARRAAGCAASVRAIGAVPDPLEWYQAADIFVLPSIREGLSNSLLEALSCALPVVSTPVSGSEDVFAAADVGALAGGPDAASLAEAIRPLLSDPERRARCAAEARRLALERFSLDRVARDVESLYQDLIGRASLTMEGIQR